MNPLDLSATALLIWGIAIHAIADIPLQNDWMAKNKMMRRLKLRTRPSDQAKPNGNSYHKEETTSWWDRHPAAYVHAGIHGLCLAVIFGWAAIPIAFVHLLIDTRKPVEWWGKLIRQTQPAERYLTFPADRGHAALTYFPLWDAGVTVRLMLDQVFHLMCIMAAALLVT